MSSPREKLRSALETPTGKKAKRVWPDFINLTIGGWMVFSAFVPAFCGSPEAQVASGLTGFAVAAISVAAMHRVERWKEAVNLLLGLWLIAAPFLLDVGSKLNPILNFTIDGGFLAAHAVYQVLYPPWRRRGRM